MANVGFPQKSTFGVITATEIRTDLVRAAVGNLQFKNVGGTDVLQMGNELVIQAHARLGTDIELRDIAANVLLASDNVGNIDQLAPITDADGVRTALVDNPGGDLELQQRGARNLLLQATVTQSAKHIKLAENIEITDSGNNTIIASDNAGHIDQLSRVDAPLTNPTGSQEISLVPMELISPSQSGTLDEDEGFWNVDAHDILYLYLNTIFNYLMSKGKVYIETITVFINTTSVNDYITAMNFNSYNIATGAEDVDVEDLDNHGQGSTGDENATLTVNTELASDRWHRLRIEAYVLTNAVKVRGIKIIYKLV